MHVSEAGNKINDGVTQKLSSENSETDFVGLEVDLTKNDKAIKQKENYLDLFKGTSPQLIAVIIGTLNALSDGMHYGWSAPTIIKLKEPNSPVKISEQNIVWIESLYMLAGLAGLPLTVYLADKIGRQRSVLLASFTSLIGWILIGTATSVGYIFAARILVGAAADVAFTCSPMYVAEIAHQKIRGFLAGIIYIMELAGVLLVYIIAPYTSVRIPPIVGACIVITQLIIFPFMPESPYYHLYKGHEIAAKKSLKRIRKESNVDNELEMIASAIRRQKTEQGRMIDLIVIKSNRKAIIAISLMNAAQHFAGITVILMNLHEILEAAGFTYIKPDKAAIIFAALMLLSAFLASLAVDKCGRKMLLMVSSLSTAICLLIIAIFFTLKQSNVEVDHISWIPTVFLMIYAITFKVGLGIVPIVITAEVFPAKVKALGMTIADGMYVLFASISIYGYQYLLDQFNIAIPFYFFATCCFGMAILNNCLIPETKGKTLEEIQMMLKQ